MTILRHALEDERHTTVAEGDPPALAGPHDWLIANLRTNGLLREAEAVRALIAALAAAPAEPQPVAQGELDPNEQDAGILWAEIQRLRAAIQGPDGYATWQEAATAERVRRVNAERALAAAAPQPAIADHACAPTELVAHESPNVSGKPTGGSPDHLLQDQSRGLSQWLASQPGARLHAREAAAAIAAPQPVAQGDDLLEIARRTGLRQHLHGVNATDARALLSAFMAAAAPAGAAPVKMSAVAKRKAADLGREGYIIAGYTMTKPGARTAVLIDAAVRWLTPEQQHVLMHVEGSVIGAPAGVVGEPVALLAPNMNFGDPGEQKYLVLGAHTHPALRELMGAFPVYTAPPARQALTDERAICEILAACWFYGGWQAETGSEREMEHLMRKIGLWPTDEDAIVGRSQARARGIGGKGGADHG